MTQDEIMASAAGAEESSAMASKKTLTACGVASALPPPKNIWEAFIEEVTKRRELLAKENQRRKPLRKKNFLQLMFMEDKGKRRREADEKEGEEECNTLAKVDTKKRNAWQEILHDFTKGDKKILRAIGRTALVNAVVALTAITGGALTSIAGYAAGGAITAKRFGDGLANENPKEVAKSLAVYGCATTASLTGQAVAGALMITVAGASLPVAAAVAFGVGCTSGITAGALSEWGVDQAWKEWGVWLRKQFSELKTLHGPEAPSSKPLVDVSMNLLCGPHNALVQQKLGLGPPQEEYLITKQALHRSDSTLETDSDTESESDTEIDDDEDSDTKALLASWNETTIVVKGSRWDRDKFTFPRS